MLWPDVLQLNLKGPYNVLLLCTGDFGPFNRGGGHHEPEGTTKPDAGQLRKCRQPGKAHLWEGVLTPAFRERHPRDRRLALDIHLVRRVAIVTLDECVTKGCKLLFLFSGECSVWPVCDAASARAKCKFASVHAHRPPGKVFGGIVNAAASTQLCRSTA